MTRTNATSTKESGHSNVVNHRTQRKTKRKQFVFLQLSNKVQTKLRVAVLVGVYSPTFRWAVSRLLSSEFTLLPISAPFEQAPLPRGLKKLWVLWGAKSSIYGKSLLCYPLLLGLPVECSSLKLAVVESSHCHLGSKAHVLWLWDPPWGISQNVVQVYSKLSFVQ